MDVGDWLRKLGLERYEAAFRKNDIDRDVLPSLTGEDLKELGVASVGHRRRLLGAIAALPGANLDRPAGSDAERRQITVMFCDLVGSTALAARTDPEDLQDIVSAYHQCIAENVGQFGGYVAEYLGDGALIYFGWPQAGEADAERAVRAGLALINAIDRMSARGEKLQSRIGVATGLVVGSGAAQARSAVGETLNLAARLQAVAEPNSMVIDHSTRAELGGLFECRDLGALELKGFPAPVRAWRVLGEASVQSRFEALHAETVIPLVGREEELDLLLRRWRQVNAGAGKIVLVSGEPGIGKSRLITAVDEQLRGEPHTRLRYFCSPYHTDSAFYPVMSQLERAAGFERDDGPGARRDKLEALLAPWTPHVEEDAALLAEALSIPTRESYTALAFTPQKRKEQISKVLLAQLAGLAQDRPVLMTFEDVHWIDPTSLELLELAVERAPSLRVLLIITFRPEFTPRWAGQAHVTMLALNRLGHDHAAALIERITGEPGVPAELREQIIDHTDGVPLFIEELTKTVLENGARLSDPGEPLSIPGTLHASLMARLDRLPAAKQVAQIGAVIGREFRHDLLMAVAALPERELQEGLDQLVAAGLLFRRSQGPEVFYQFKHVLVRDAAYESLLRRHRGSIHAKIVLALQRLSPEVATTEPEVLGHHCERAGLIEQAADCYRAAGERSIAQSAMAEARAHLERGVRLVELMADGPERRRLEAALQLALANVGIISDGYGATEIALRLSRAVHLSRGIGHGELLIRALFGEWTYKLHVGDLAGSLVFAQEMAALGQRQQDAGLRLAAATTLGMNHAFAGRFTEARSVLEACLTEKSADGSEGIVAPLAQDAEVLARSFLSLPLASLGHIGQAANELERAIERARRLRHHPSLAVALAIGCRQAWLVRDEGLVRERAQQLLSLCEREGYPYWLARGQCYAGAIAMIDGSPEHGLALLRRGMATLRDSGVMLWNIYSLVADAHARCGHKDAALRFVDKGLDVSAQTTEVWTDAELHRLRGSILLIPPEPDEAAAEAQFHRAIEIARGQSAKLLELRGTVSLARLLTGADRREAARALLAPIFGWFREDASAIDLRDAGTLLEALA